MNKFIPLSVPNLCGKELEYTTEAIKAQWVSTGGEFINTFERNITEYVGSAGAVACQSGTSGLHLALLALGIGQGDEVIVPALTFIAAVNPVTYVNAAPVFMDCDDSLCMDTDKLEEFLETECFSDEENTFNKTTGKKISAVVVVHVFGNVANVEKLLELSKKYNFKIIEDATEALGSRVVQKGGEEKFAGTFGDIGVFSFNGNKIITCGGGGMLVSNDESYLEKAKYLSTQAKDDALYFIHNNIGYNYRMTNIQASVGVAQLELLESFIRIKNKNYDCYLENGVNLLGFREDVKSNKWFYSYMTGSSEKRDCLIQKLNDAGIQVRPVWHLINELPPYERAQSFKICKAKYYQDRIVNLPCSTNLSGEDVEYICKKVKEYDK